MYVGCVCNLQFRDTDETDDINIVSLFSLSKKKEKKKRKIFIIVRDYDIRHYEGLDVPK